MLTRPVPLSYPLFACQVDRRVFGLGMALRWLLCLCGALLSNAATGAGLAVRAAELPAHAPLGLVWEAELAEDADYPAQVEALMDAYEGAVGRRLTCGARGKVGLKVNTRAGRGLSTPLPLLRALIEVLRARGFERENILIVDYSTYDLRQAGILPALSLDQRHFDGCPVVALDSEDYYDADWFYDSPLPPAVAQDAQMFMQAVSGQSLAEGVAARKSFLPAPLLFEVDFWINLAVGVDDPILGVDGALANASLWNVSNSQRFVENLSTASVAVAEIAAIPELHERLVLHFVSLQRYQFIGGPRFNSLYTRSEPRLWMSSDAVALDRLLLERINSMRLLHGFPEIAPMPQQLRFAASLGLGVFEFSDINLQPIAPQRSAALEPAE